MQAQPDTYSNVLEVKKKPVKKCKQAQPDAYITPVANKLTRQTPPLKLTCEILLSPTALAQIAEHTMEDLFLKEMRQNLHQDDYLVVFHLCNLIVVVMSPRLLIHGGSVSKQNIAESSCLGSGGEVLVLQLCEAL
jgi:hypothetical protein